MEITVRERFRGSLLGLAAGDALGTTVEFRPRGSFVPLVDMVGGGPFQLAPGQWTDDTSMALCLAASLVETGRFDPLDQMERYCRWREDGYQSSIGRCFDIGIATRESLERYRQTGECFAGSTDPRSAGNGCIMRLAPVPMFFFGDEASAKAYSGESSRTTHGATKADVLLGHSSGGDDLPRIGAIARGEYLSLAESNVRSGGYVVDCLEAALWCFAQTQSYETAVLRAANLGHDADTTAAVCGQLAGAFYGAGAIPARWLARLALRGQIEALADGLHAAGTQR